MKRLLVCAIVAFAMVAAATADEFTGIVSKFEDGKVTFTGIKGTLPKIDLPVAANAKFLKAKYSVKNGDIVTEVEGDYEGGKDAFAKAVKDAIDKKNAAYKDKNKSLKFDVKNSDFAGILGTLGGVFAHIITEGEGDKAQITEIRVISLPIKK